MATFKSSPPTGSRKRAIFGIRSCDVAGIWHLDRFYLGREFRDIYYEKRRKNLFLVNVVCTDPERDIGEECFCPCADTGPAAREHFDLQLMDLGEEFMAVAGTPAGRGALRRSHVQEGHRGARREAPRHPGRRPQALQDHDELVLRHGALCLPGQDPGKDLGGDRQPLPGVRRLHLRLPGLHLLHGERPPGRAERNRAGPHLGRLRA